MADGRGLYKKFNVERVDGKDRPGGPKEGARYFVLDYVNDPAARRALMRYARDPEVLEEEPALAEDLLRELQATAAPADMTVANALLQELMDVADSARAARKEIPPCPPHPGPHPGWAVGADPSDREAFRAAMDRRNAEIDAWDEADREYRLWQQLHGGADAKGPPRAPGRRWFWLVVHNLFVHPLMGLWQLLTIGLVPLPAWLERLHTSTYPEE